MARAIWKGRITFEEVELPVKLYSAVQSRSVHFRMLDAKRHEPITQRMVNPESGKVVPYEDIRRAVETGSGELVMLNEEELETLKPEASRTIELTRFVPPDEITHLWYDRPYYLGPDDSDDGYFALAEALRKKKVEGVARWVMRNKEYVGALRAVGDHLMLITLRHAGEVLPASQLSAPGGRDLDKREIEMAKRLVSAMEDELDFAAFTDEYRERVLELVEAKAAGKVIKFPKAPEKRRGESLADALEKSLASAKKGRRSD
jgi:DNA end-binding protein Ku